MTEAATTEETLSSEPHWSTSLENYVRGLAENPGAMADLRSGLNKTPDQCHRMHRWVARFVPSRLLNTSYEAAVYTVASLAAFYPRAGRTDRNLGWSLRRALQGAKLSEQGMEARLVRLARSNSSTDLSRNLRPLVSLLETTDTPISWSQLARDIGRWDGNSGDVARAWMRSFFQNDASGEKQIIESHEGESSAATDT